MSTEEWDLHEIRIHGAETGPLPLSWGQATVWELFTALGPESRCLNLVGDFTVRNSVGVSEALARIEECLIRFDASRLVFHEKGEAALRNEAVVSVRISADPGPGKGTGKDSSSLYTRPFGLRESPVRLELLHRDKAVTQVGIALSHLVFDGAAYRLLEHHLRQAVEGREPAEPGIQNEALMAYERSDPSTRRSDAIIDQWVKAATRLPPGIGLLPTGPGAYTVTEIRSHSMAIALQALAVAHGASTVAVLIAAMARTIRRGANRQLPAVLSLCNNRMHPQLRNFVGQSIGNGLILLPDERAASDFTSFLKAVTMRTLAAYARARYDSRKWRDVLFDLSEKGRAPDLCYYFDDRRDQRDAWSGLEERVGALRQGSTEETSVRVTGRRDMSDAVFFANLHDAGQRCRISLLCDDTRIPPADAAVLLEGLEAFLVEQALAL